MLFFIKDRIDKGEVKVEYCPLICVLADFFTKPSQGKLFREVRKVLMGHKLILWLEQILSTIKERAVYFFL